MMLRSQPVFPDITSKNASKPCLNYYGFVIIGRGFFMYLRLWKTIVVHKCPQMSVDDLWITVDNCGRNAKIPMVSAKTECG